MDDRITTRPRASTAKKFTVVPTTGPAMKGRPTRITFRVRTKIRARSRVYDPHWPEEEPDPTTLIVVEVLALFAFVAVVGIRMIF
jgi:hypothetical protein